MPNMNMHHRINVWRIGNVCPVCGAGRGYSHANSSGIECNCSDKENCGYAEFFSNSFIHEHTDTNDKARFEVLDQDNKVIPGWGYTPTKRDLKQMTSVQEEARDNRRWVEMAVKRAKRETVKE